MFLAAFCLRKDLVVSGAEIVFLQSPHPFDKFVKFSCVHCLYLFRSSSIFSVESQT